MIQVLQNCKVSIEPKDDKPMNLLDITENLPIKDPVTFIDKLRELVAARSDMVSKITVAVRTDDGFLAVATSGDNLGESVYEFTCAINATITGSYMKVADIKKNELEV